MEETGLTKKVKKSLEAWSLVDSVEKVHQSGFTPELGKPDICGRFTDGTEFHLELKSEGKAFSGLKWNQALSLWKKARQGACVGVIATMEDFDSFNEHFHVNLDIIERRLNRGDDKVFIIPKNRPLEGKQNE